MPIVTITEDSKTTYYAVTEADECRVDALVDEYKLSDSSSREYAEHALHREYLRRLTEHAYECAQLAHLVVNPPNDQEPLGRLGLAERLAEKIAKDAVWLRTYEPFTALTAEAVAAVDDNDNETYGTRLRISDARVSSLDDDSWAATDHALWERGPWRRDHFARLEQEKAEKEAARKLPPAAQKRVDAAAKMITKAIDMARKASEKRTATVANKIVRRSKSKAGGSCKQVRKAVAS